MMIATEKLRGAVQKKITFLADFSDKGGRPCPLINCKFFSGEKMHGIFLNFSFKNLLFINYVNEENTYSFTLMSVKV